MEDNRRAIHALLEKREMVHTYNVAGDNEKKNTEIAAEILRHLSLPDTMIEYVSDRPGHDLRYSLDCEKIHDLGWNPVSASRRASTDNRLVQIQRMVVAPTG